MRVILTAVLMQCLFLAGSGWGRDEAYAGTPDKFGNNAEIYSISIVPDSVPTGTHPRIIGFVRNTSSPRNGSDGKAVFDVVAVITLPKGSQKSLLWRSVSFSAEQRKSYAYDNSYDSKQAGRYKVMYSVYNSGRTHLYASLAKSFTISSTAATVKPVQPTEHAVKGPEAATAGQTKKESMPKAVGTAESRPRQTTTTQARKPSEPDRRAGTGVGDRRKYVGIGGYVNTINFSGGPSLILWPMKDLAVQGAYGLGTFTTYEARALYRLPLVFRFKPYLGAGYLHAVRSASVLGVDTKIKGDSFTAFAGIELPFSKNLYAYIDVSGTPLKLKQEVVSGNVQATATVKYSPVTVCMGLVLYVF